MTLSIDLAVATRLRGFESASAPYGQAITPFESQGGHVVLISDLHLAAGARRDGTYAGTENFFAGAAFERFLDYARGQFGGGKSATLVINGDFIDFLRIMDVPQSEDEFRDWQHLLQQIDRDVPMAQLRAVSRREVRHGFKTQDYKSVWKLATAAKGHPRVFESLARWIDAGHRVVIVKGNHDLEWYWEAVRNCLRLLLAQRLPRAGTLRERLEWVLPRLAFADHGLSIDGEIYVEHGHRFERVTAVVGPPAIRGGAELNIPFGSFFNRYLINHVELNYPYVDNVRPQQNIVPLMIRERFLTALKLLGYLAAMVPNIPLRYYRYVLGRPLAMIATIAVPVAIALFFAGANGVQLFAGVLDARSTGSPLDNALLREGRDLLLSFGGLLSSYVFAQLLAAWQLDTPPTLEGVGCELLGLTTPDRVPANDPVMGRGYRLVACGHTHNPWQFEQSGRWFFNLGTWIPVVEISSADVRWDRTYTYLHIPPKRDGAWHAALWRWDDEAGVAGRPAQVTVVRRDG